MSNRTSPVWTTQTRRNLYTIILRIFGPYDPKTWIGKRPHNRPAHMTQEEADAAWKKVWDTMAIWGWEKAPANSSHAMEWQVSHCLTQQDFTVEGSEGAMASMPDSGEPMLADTSYPRFRTLRRRNRIAAVEAGFLSAEHAEWLFKLNGD